MVRARALIALCCTAAIIFFLWSANIEWPYDTWPMSQFWAALYFKITLTLACIIAEFPTIATFIAGIPIKGAFEEK